MCFSRCSGLLSRNVGKSGNSIGINKLKLIQPKQRKLDPELAYAHCASGKQLNFGRLYTNPSLASSSQTYKFRTLRAEI
jgi:hypothetical protein